MGERYEYSVAVARAMAPLGVGSADAFHFVQTYIEDVDVGFERHRPPDMVARAIVRKALPLYSDQYAVENPLFASWSPLRKAGLATAIVGGTWFLYGMSQHPILGCGFLSGVFGPVSPQEQSEIDRCKEQESKGLVLATLGGIALVAGMLMGFAGMERERQI